MATIPTAVSSGDQFFVPDDPNRTRKTVIRWLTYLLRYGLLLAYMVVCLYPFVWMVVTSLRDQRSVFTAGGSLWVSNPNWQNYTDIWDSANLPRAFVNTLVITAVCMVFTIITTSMTSYAIARSDFPGRQVILFCLLMTLLIPGEMLIIPTFYVNKTFGFVGDGKALLAVILVTVAGGQAFNVYMMLGHFRTIPRDLFDSAELDGESYFGVYWRIAFPLIRPAVATVSLLTFMGVWNAYITPLVYLAPLKDFQTLTIALVQYSKQFQTLYHVMAAGAVIGLVPVIVVFIFLQRYFIRGLTEGATKG
jgi:multiple sugar transport system permease protein